MNVVGGGSVGREREVKSFSCAGGCATMYQHEWALFNRESLIINSKALNIQLACSDHEMAPY
jgi:hypothetical protein